MITDFEVNKQGNLKTPCCQSRKADRWERLLLTLSEVQFMILVSPSEVGLFCRFESSTDVWPVKIKRFNQKNSLQFGRIWKQNNHKPTESSQNREAAFWPIVFHSRFRRQSKIWGPPLAKILVFLRRNGHRRRPKRQSILQTQLTDNQQFATIFTHSKGRCSLDTEVRSQDERARFVKNRNRN
jgi:hypothetical protein